MASGFRARGVAKLEWRQFIYLGIDSNRQNVTAYDVK
jgi:hypothetical protein